MSAKNKDEFNNNINSFIDIDDKPVIFEVFTNSDDESDALHKMLNLGISLKKIAKDMLGQKGIKIAKKMLGK